MTARRIAACLLALPLIASALSPGLQEAVERVRHFDYTEPTAPLHQVSAYTPVAAGDAAQRVEWAAALAQAAVATGTTAFGRTILCQQLALVAGPAERPLLDRLLADPASAADAAIALAPLRGEVVAGSPPPQRDACLAQLASARPADRIAGLAALARFHAAEAAGPAMKSMDDSDRAVAATAIQIAARQAPLALAGRLDKLPATSQVIALQALTDVRAREAAAAIRTLLSSSDPAVARAAVQALGELGGAEVIAAFAPLAEARPDMAAAVTESLTLPAADGFDAALLAALPAATPGYRACLIQAATARGSVGLDAVLLREAGQTNAAVRTAALKALGRSASPAVYGDLVNLLAGELDPAAEAAVGAAGRRLPPGVSRSAPLVALLARPGVKPDAQAAAMRLLAAAGEPAGLEAVAARAADFEPAFRALCAWTDAAALPSLAVQAERATNDTARVLALRGIMRLSAGQTNAIAWLKRIQPLLRTTDDKRAFIGALAPAGGPEALAIVSSFAADPALKAEAESARDRITAALPPSLLRRAELAAELPAGAILRAYLDCGAERENPPSDPVRIREPRALQFRWTEAERPATRAAATTAYDAECVKVELAGLDPARRYTVGFTWWDGDGKGRTMSAWAGTNQLAAARVLPKGPPAAPATVTAPLPAGADSVEFRRVSGDNAAVGEVWVIENAAAPGPAVRVNAGAATKVLIVTGLDYPGHKWRETTPVLTAALAQDDRLEVSVVEDASFLASPQLTNYAAIVLHYMNWENPGPGAAAQENLRKALESGTGLVLVHFACGAFQGWSEFQKMVGRVWDPKRRGHDPRGPFSVHIIDADHPVTKSFKDFTTDDELYTCLVGDTPIHLLADAESKVDHARYPMAFTCQYGKGRVFFSTLGHDVRALGGEVGRLYRRGAAWSAGLAPGA